MASVSNPLIGKSSGSVGAVTFSTWRGINVIRTKPTTVAQPASDSRTMRQSALAGIVAIYRSIKTVVDLTFKGLAVHQSAYNAFASYNLKNAFDYSAPPVATLVIDNLLISKGTIEATPILTNTCDVSDGNVTLTFPTTISGSNQSATDKAVVVIYNETQGKWEGHVTTAARSTGSVSQELIYPAIVGDAITAYLAFVSVSGNLSSDSTNSSFTTIA